MTGEQYKWKKISNSDLPAVENLLRGNEHKYVNACGKYLTRSPANDSVWLLKNKKKEITALLINSRSTLIPVLFGKKEIPAPVFLENVFNKKKLHSIQGLTNEVIIFDKIIEKTGRKITDYFDYDLMDLDKLPKQGGDNSLPAGLVLRKPGLTDINAITPLQAAYEQEEVIPKGAVFSPAASRVNLVNIIAKGLVLAAELNGQIIGKINVNTVSFSRYQVGGVFVHPDFRGKGIARKMAFEFISNLINQGKGVTLFVKKNNEPARRLYAGLGFLTRDDFRITYY
ncbi:MAG: GNAT family N-acetyltransferase [Treponema sp.]|nr:GNAT family N-acetyltransferase [Treponema sp.]